MIIAKNRNALEFSSKYLPNNYLALKANPNKTVGNNRSNHSMLLIKFLTFCLLGMVLFSGCKKEEDLLPSTSTAKMNDAYLKADAPTYYVATTGSDANGDGSYAKPWASLYKASQMVTTSGYVIHIAAGSYTESHVCSIAVGVSIVGDGATTIIHGTYSTTGSSDLTGATISLVSGSQGTNGNQSISNLTLDGNALTGSRAISVKNRSHVLLHHIIVKDFFLGGVVFYNSGAWSSSPPAAYEIGNQLYNSTIDNCGDTDATWNGGGLILIACQQDLLIHDNLLYSTKRSGAHNGNIINAGGRYFKGVKYYNNHSWKPDPTYSGWNFHIEVWDNMGGFEIYNNTFTGGSIAVDMAGFKSSVGIYDYSWSVHDNIFEQNDPALISYNFSTIHIECHEQYKTLIYNNTFNSGYVAINCIAWQAKDISIHDNIGYKLRYLFQSSYAAQGNNIPPASLYLTNLDIYRNKIHAAINGGSYYGNIHLTADHSIAISKVNILNNTMVCANTQNSRAVEITIPSGGSVTNVNVKNNIFEHFRNGEPIKVDNSGTFNGLHIENNLSYNLNNYNILPKFTGNSVSNYTYKNNIPTSNTTQVNPLFVNESTQNYTLQATSSAVNSGQLISMDASNLPYLGSLPDRGYIEYVESGGTGTVVVLGTVSLTSNATYPIMDASSLYAPADVLTDGGGIISERGLVWNTSANPTTANNKVAMGAGVGHFSPYVEGLNSNTTYYFRSYCTNEAGTSYSNEVVKYKFSEGVTIDTSNAIQPIVIPDQTYDRNESRDKRDSLYRTIKDGKSWLNRQTIN
jgi:hypothetical protein